MLNDKGTPTPLAHTLLCAPESRMGTVTDAEIAHVVAASKLVDKYKEAIDRESAYEILNNKIKQTVDISAMPTASKLPSNPEPAAKKPSGKRQKSTIEEIASSPLAKQVGRTLTREITRGLFGVLGIKTRRK